MKSLLASVIEKHEKMTTPPFLKVLFTGMLLMFSLSLIAAPRELCYRTLCDETHLNYDEPHSGYQVSQITRNYVILFFGGPGLISNREHYYLQLKDTYRTLLKIGIPAKNIYILYADGKDPLADQRTKTGYKNSDMSFAAGSPVYAATSSNFDKVFARVANKVSSKDHFLFFAFCMGYWESPELQHMRSWENGIIPNWQLARNAAWINAKYATYIVDSDYSDGMIKNFHITKNVFRCSSTYNCPRSNYFSYHGDYTGFAQGALAELDTYGAGTTTTRLFETAWCYSGGDQPQSYGKSFFGPSGIFVGNRYSTLFIPDFL